MEAPVLKRRVSDTGGQEGWRSFVSIIALTLMVGACADRQPERAEPKQEAPATDCAELLITVRESAVASGVPDGEARRLADQARVRCEAKEGIPSPNEFVDVPCADDVERRNAHPVTNDTKMVGVYFSCRADFATFGLPEQPVYLFMREIPAELTDIPDEQLEGAILAYIAGPTPEQTGRGYISAAPASLADVLQVVQIDGGVATIDFSADVANRLGNLGTSTATDVFVNELAGTVFQFESIDQLTLRLEGDCERFWRLRQRTCTVIQRP